MSTTLRVTICRKQGLSDPEGATTKKALSDLGFDSVDHVSFGRIITITVDQDDVDLAKSETEAMCTKLLANPVMEEFSIDAIS
ncbi:MAG: phosphoribosylformylglycinamidine synthase subunit PurS [Acidimicrobiia bacterium]